MAIHVGNYGQTFRVNVELDGDPMDLTSATLITLILTSPTAVTVTKTMVGENGCATWEITSGVFSAAGRWTATLAIIRAGKAYHGTFTFPVEP